MNTFGRSLLGDATYKILKCCIPNIKALHLPVSEKKNFEDGLLYFYVPTCDPRGWASFDPRGII